MMVMAAPVMGSHATHARHTAIAASGPPSPAAARAWLNRA
jgi:hypothetical protein